MSAAHITNLSPQPTGLGQTSAPRIFHTPANDNCHLHLVKTKYGAAGQTIFTSFPSNSSTPTNGTNMVYDGLGRMVGVGSGGVNYASAMSYHPSGTLAGLTYGNGQVFSQTLNARLQPLRMLSQKGASKALDLTYTYDVRGKVTNILNGAISGDDRTYGYDALGRLTSSTGPWGSGTYSYDALGNIRTKTVGGRALVMSYDAKNRLVSHTDSGGPNRTLGYDARGNVTGLGGLFFSYDRSDQPINISGTASGTYRYDGNKRRVKAVVDGKTIYNVYDQSGTLVHIDKVTDGKKIDYIGKIARITNGTPTYLHMDHLGSVQTITSANGLVLCREQYTPFGQTLSNPFCNKDQAGYTGHIKDSATGLNYMQARYYDPLIGRFLSIDPVGFSPDMPFMFGRYTYVNNDPVNAIDPDGKQMVTNEQRQLASQGKVNEFWESRAESGDPIAGMGVEFGKPPSEQSLGVYQSAGVLKNKIFEKIISEKTPNEVTNIDQAIASEVSEVRQDLMNAHIEAVDNDFEGRTDNFLSAGQITKYHQEVFGNRGLPPNTFGGSQLTGTKTEGKITGAFIWCKTCDKK